MDEIPAGATAQQAVASDTTPNVREGIIRAENHRPMTTIVRLGGEGWGAPRRRKAAPPRGKGVRCQRRRRDETSASSLSRTLTLRWKSDRAREPGRAGIVPRAAKSTSRGLASVSFSGQFAQTQRGPPIHSAQSTGGSVSRSWRRCVRAQQPSVHRRSGAPGGRSSGRRFFRAPAAPSRSPPGNVDQQWTRLTSVPRCREQVAQATGPAANQFERILRCSNASGAGTGAGGRIAACTSLQQLEGNTGFLECGSDDRRAGLRDTGGPRRFRRMAGRIEGRARETGGGRARQGIVGGATRLAGRGVRLLAMPPHSTVDNRCCRKLPDLNP